jgi:hypothetical protein
MTEPFASSADSREFRSFDRNGRLGTGPDFLAYDARSGRTLDVVESNIQTHPSVEAGRPRRAGRTRPGANGGTIPDAIIVPHWDDDDGELWDRITLGRYQFRGTVHIDGDGPALQLDKRKRPGANGARLVTKGYDLADFKIVLRVWTREHLEDFSALMPEIHPARTGQPIALDVYHPMLALVSINRALIYKVGLLKETGTPGLRECELGCAEYRPPTNRNATQTVAANRRLGTLQIDPIFDTSQERDNPNTVAPPSAQNVNP